MEYQRICSNKTITNIFEVTLSRLYCGVPSSAWPSPRWWGRCRRWRGWPPSQTGTPYPPTVYIQTTQPTEGYHNMDSFERYYAPPFSLSIYSTACTLYSICCWKEQCHEIVDHFFRKLDKTWLGKNGYTKFLFLRRYSRKMWVRVVIDNAESVTS